VHHSRIKILPGSNAFHRTPDFGRRPGRGRGLSADDFSHLLANHPEPQRSIRGVAIRRVVAMNGVWQRAVLLESLEGYEDLLYFLHHSRRQQPAGANERVATPIEKPWIPCDDGLAVAPPHDKRLRRLRQPE